MRVKWKPIKNATACVRYAYIDRSKKLQHTEVYFFLKYFYYLLLDKNKFVYYNVFNRSSAILHKFIGLPVRVYRGFRWRTFFVTKWHVGFKFGEFAKTKQRAIFRSKTLKKKKKSPNVEYLSNLRINRLRSLKSGKVRKQRISIISTGSVIY